MTGRTGMDFSPLATSDPVPGDPHEVSRLAQQYATTADEIERQADRLRKLASGTDGGWDSDAGRAFGKKAKDLAGRIEAAHHRYVAAGDALKAWVDPLTEAQSKVATAVEDARQATATLNATVPVPAKPGAPPPTDAQKAAASALATKHSGAADQLSAAKADFEGAVSRYHDHASRLASKLDSVTGHDDVHDGFWDKVGGWIHDHAGVLKTVVRILGYVGAALAITIMVVALFIPGVDIVDGLALSVFLGYLSAGVSFTSLFGDVALAADGDEGWYWAGMDVLSMASFGAGRVLSKSLEAALPAVTARAADVAGTRAAADVAADADKALRYTKLLGSSSPAVVARAQAGLDALSVRATAAGATARQGVLDVGKITPGLAQRMKYGGMIAAKVKTIFPQLRQAAPGVSAVDAAAARATRLSHIAGFLTYFGPARAVTNQAILHVFHWKGPDNLTRAPIFSWP